MKKILFLCTLYLGLGLSFAYAQKSKTLIVEGTFENQPLLNFLEKFEQTHNVNFFYQEKWLKGISINGTFNQVSLERFFPQVLKDSRVRAVFFDEHSVVFLKGSYQQNLAFQRTASQSKVFDKLVGNPEKPIGVSAELSGKVLDGESGEPVLGATVQIKELGKGAITKMDGSFQFEVPVGVHKLTVEFVGMETEKVTLGIFEDGEIEVELFQAALQMNEVTVTAIAEDNNISNVNMGANLLNISSIKKMPAMMGEVDVVRSLILLPGVSTTGEASTGFNVRGGDVSQNLILMENAPIFNPSHLFGFFSVFNPDAVEDVSLFKGAVPAKYGGRASSVLDVKQKDGSYKKLEGQGGVGILASRLSLNGPIVKDRVSFLAAGRIAYPNLFLSMLDVPELKESSASFYDFTGKLNIVTGENSQLKINGYHSNDEFKLGSDTIYSWQNSNASIKYNKAFSDNFFMDLVGVYSKYNYDVDNSEEDRGFNLNFGIDYMSLGADFQYNAGKHTISFGASALNHTVSPGSFTPLEGNISIEPLYLPEENGVEAAVYVSDEIKFSQSITLNLGLRYSWFGNLGPATVSMYDPEQPRIPTNIIDSKTYSDLDLVQTYQGLEPRIGLRVGVGATSSIKVGANRMRQYLHLITNSSSVTPLDFWKVSGPYLKPQIADQVSLGYFRNFRNDNVEFSIEGYYKTIENVVDFKNGAELVLNESIETVLLQGQGRAYGVELMLKRKQGRLNGWVGYTYSRSERKLAGDFSDEVINNGDYYPSNFDKPHDLTIVANYELKKKITLSCNFTYSTGRPTTAPNARYLIEDITVANYSNRNEYRIPDYHRLDVSLTFDGNHKKNKVWKGSWVFGVYNVYGRENPYSVFFQNKQGAPPRAYQLSIIGSALPSVTYNFTFL
ncbi:TonB-dependent receptor [Flammeovirgaceae bacterium SG7u.111]|nr:TonB-dependent receptor [Flammeovirgaceae bacterium SG7u.132]WPO33252.1 TonB-dependent receptor [Flammeovirgaceae bacterium SG7u.111]